MSTDVKCAFLFDIKRLFYMPKSLYFRDIQGSAYKPTKNIHFSDKVGVGVYSGPRQCFHCHPKNNTPLIASPLISTKTSDESQIFFNKFLAKKIHFRSKKIIKKNIALAMFGRDE